MQSNNVKELELELEWLQETTKIQRELLQEVAIFSHNQLIPLLIKLSKVLSSSSWQVE